MHGCPIDDSTLDHLRAEIEAAPLRPHHGALLDAVGRVLAGRAFRFALTRGGWYRPGGVIRADGERVAADLESWAAEALRDCGDDMAEFLDRHAGEDLCATRHAGRTHYFVCAHGPGPADYLQLEVEEMREVLDRHLLNPEALPTDLGELTDPLLPALLDAQPVAPARYAFRRLSDMRLVAAQLSGPGDATSRFLSEWSASSASGKGHFSDHWILALREHQDRFHNLRLSASPVSLLARKLKSFHWHPECRGVPLADQIHAFDRAAGYSAAWYFHLVAGALVPRAIAGNLMLDIQEDFRYLPEADAALLRNWLHAPYST